MDEIIDRVMAGEELDMDALKEVTGGIMMTALDMFGHALTTCSNCALKDEQCSAYLREMDAKFRAIGGDVHTVQLDINCPHGRQLPQ